VWAGHVVDGDLAYEIDARQIPPEWSTGFVPLRRGRPYELPVDDNYGESYTLNEALADWAFSLTKSLPLGDSEKIQRARARFAGFPNALKPPFVTRGDDLSSSTFWHGSNLEDWANAWTRYYTAGKGNYMVTAMEDTGTLQALTFLSHAGRVDLRRVLVLRTISNFDREPPGGSVAESLQSIVAGNYSAYMESLNAAYLVADCVVRDLIAHWPEREAAIPSAP
jgi:purine nucleoside permease